MNVRPLPVENEVFRGAWWYWGLLTLGVVIRLRAFLTNRSLWLDEAMLALNLRNRGFAALTQPLDMDQIAPVGFLWLEKCVVLALGDAEWALRLVPLLCGLALLPMAYAAVLSMSNARVATCALAVLALHPQLVYFSQEVKPYGLDAFAVVVVMLVAASLAYDTASRFPWSVVTVAALLPWFSFTSVFVLPGLLLTLAIAAIRRRSPRALVHAVVTTSVFLLSCGLEYGLILRHQTGNSLMQSYWAETFPKNVSSIAGLGPWALTTAHALLQEPGMIPAPLLIPLMIIFVTGLYYWSRQSPAVFWTIVCAIGLGFLAAILRVYPPQGRLWLFAVPLLVIAVAGGIEFLLQWILTTSTFWTENKTAFAVGALIVFFGPATWITVNRTVQTDRICREDVRGICEFILAHRHPGDSVYVSRAAGPAMLWYLGRPEFRPLQEIPMTWGDVINGSPTHAEAEVSRFPASPRLWLLFAHTVHAADDPQSDAQRLRDALAPHAQSVILHKAAPNDFEHEPAWTELFLRKP